MSASPEPPPPARLQQTGQRAPGWLRLDRAPEPLKPHIRAVTAPFPATYEAELSSASWLRVFGAVAAVALVVALMLISFLVIAWVMLSIFVGILVSMLRAQ